MYEANARGAHAVESWVTEVVHVNPNHHDVFFGRGTVHF